MVQERQELHKPDLNIYKYRTICFKQNHLNSHTPERASCWLWALSVGMEECRASRAEAWVYSGDVRVGIAPGPIGDKELGGEG